VKRPLRLLVSGAIALGAVSGVANAQQLAHRFIEIVPDVYAAVGNGTIQTQDTVAVVINEHDVLLVDTNITPEATRRLVADIKTLTDKPIRYVVNTHWHYDHTDGNQIFGPEVQIIGHVNARKAIVDGVLAARLEVALSELPATIDALRSRVEAEQDPARRAELEQQLTVRQAYGEQLKETVPTPPNVTVTDRLTIYSGDREIQIIHPGLGHSVGDLLVYLPAERVIVTGDFWEGSRTGALRFGFHDLWADNLEPLKDLDFEHVIAGHGPPFTGKETIGYFQEFLRDLWEQTKALHDQKVPVGEAAARVDLTKHQAHFANFRTPGTDERTIQRIYNVLDER
jgi:glyoxylase-like metal-dependent hydrolase (beta-lactamase superfamily II)